MRVKTGISGRPCQFFLVLVGDVSASVRVLVAFAETEVDHVNNVLHLSAADQEVVWFDISVDETQVVHELETLQHLNKNHQHSF